MVTIEGGFVNKKGPLGRNSSFFVLTWTFFRFDENLT